MLAARRRAKGMAAALRLVLRRARLAAAAGAGAALSSAAVTACDAGLDPTSGRWAWPPLLDLKKGAEAEPPLPSMVVASLPAALGYSNDGDALVDAWRGTSAKVVWHVRHGESEGNVPTPGNNCHQILPFTADISMWNSWISNRKSPLMTLSTHGAGGEAQGPGS